MINISPRQLDVFVQIALHGSVRAAAERLHIAQPAASMALAEMERQLDAPVFDRERGRLRLNARGRELLLAHRREVAVGGRVWQRGVRIRWQIRMSQFQRPGHT